MSLTLSRIALRSLADLQSMSGGPWNNCTIKLYTNSVSINNQSVAADFTEPVVNWYSALTPADFSGSYYNEDGNLELNPGSVEFVAASPDEMIGVRGYFVIDGDGNYLGAEAFDDEVLFVADGDEHDFVPRLVLRS